MRKVLYKIYFYTFNNLYCETAVQELLLLSTPNIDSHPRAIRKQKKKTKQQKSLLLNTPFSKRVGLWLGLVGQCNYKEKNRGPFILLSK